MPTLTPNIENRVRKLPKPSNATQSLQPLFEGVSNAMFAIEDEFGDDIAKGRIDIVVSNLSNPSAIEIMIADDGIGFAAKLSKQAGPPQAASLRIAGGYASQPLASPAQPRDNDERTLIATG